VDVAARRVFRLASGVALAVAIGYGLNLPMQFLCAVMTLILLAEPGGIIGLKAGLGLLLVMFLTLGTGLLLVPVMLNYAFAGIMIVALGLYHCFYQGLKGGNPLIGRLMVIGLTMITAAGTASFSFALTVIEALAKATLVAVIIGWVVYPLFPEDPTQDKKASPSGLPAEQARWIAARSLLVVMPVFMVALYDPSKYMPMILQSVSLSQQLSTTDTRNAGRELIGSALVGGIFALIFWCLLGMLPILWMFFLWTLLFFLYIASKLYRVVPTQYPPSFWLNAGVNMLILLGPAVQDSNNGKDVMAAFAVRLGLFVVVTLYAWGTVRAIDSWRERNKAGKQALPSSP
jgi:uncharacterized membrane protein YccC